MNVIYKFHEGVDVPSERFADLTLDLTTLAGMEPSEHAQRMAKRLGVSFEVRHIHVLPHWEGTYVWRYRVENIGVFQDGEEKGLTANLDSVLYNPSELKQLRLSFRQDS